MINPVAVLALLGDLYTQGEQQNQIIVELRAENEALRAQIENGEPAQ